MRIMGKRGPARRRAVLRYPSHWFEPEDLLSFIELRPFTRRWEQLKLSDTDLQVLQVMIMTQPYAGAVIEGTGGLRKLRFAPPNWRVGKSGALRVCYANVEEVGTVILALVYSKGERDDLDADQRSAVRGAIERVRRLLLSRPYRHGPPAGAEDR
jgi:hypothetical protein